MRCDKFMNIISAYVDSEASCFEQLALQEHLKSCALCKNELESQYKLKEMLKEYRAYSADGNINIVSSVMSAIMSGNGSADDAFTRAAGGDIARAGSSMGWVAMALIFMLSLTAVFSVHKINSQAGVASAETVPYTTYVYEHLSTPEMTGLYYNDPNIKQVSFSK